MKRSLLLFVLLAILAAPFAVASNFGSTGTTGITGTTNGVWLTGNSSFYVARVSLTSAYSSAVSNVMTNQYNPTDLTAYVSSPTYCDASLDVCVFDSNYGNTGINGWNSC